MHFSIHTTDRLHIAELVNPSVVIRSVHEALDIMAEAYHAGAEALILTSEHLAPDFFDLKTGLAGAILQKFSNYRMKLAIVGAFAKPSSNSLRDFIYESNEGKQICFAGSIDEAIAMLEKK